MYCDEPAPLGQASGAVGVNPLGPVWCFDLTPLPDGFRTAVEGPNSWSDGFNLSEHFDGDDRLMRSFDDGDLGYRVFSRAGANPPAQTVHWVSQDHWMVDASPGFTGGASLSPDRSFSFVDGVFVLEGSVAASIPEYGNDTWPELTIASAPAPTGDHIDQLYAYGQFGGEWAVGCRLQESRYPVCAVYAPSSSDAPGDHCFSVGARVVEVSSFQQCGDVHYGGGPFGELADVWPACVPDGPDGPCRARFRMEVETDGIRLYVNDVLYFEDSGWPADRRIPIGGEWWAYQSEWQVRSSDTFRYHWDNFVVNP